MNVSAAPADQGIGRAHDQFAVLNPSKADQTASQFLYLFEVAFDDNDFQTHVMIEVRMHRGNDDRMIFMLQFHEFVGEESRMVVVDQGDRSNYEDVARLQAGFVQAVTDEVANGFGPVFISLAPYETIKPFQEVGIKSNSGSD